MSTAVDILPVSEIHEPADPQQLVATVEACFADSTAIYPVGGATSCDFGLPARKPGVGISLAKLDRVIDYPARDMTITVEAGVTLGALRTVLAAEHQQLPLDVPHADRATLGGIVACNFNGPRRYGYGTVRDYVIGVGAVDGRGRPFKGGGRVVKNVAGYDFCKLLTGSLGTLGVISQLTFKLKPLPQHSVLVACAVGDLDQAETLLAALVNSETSPAAIELVAGPAWQDEPAFAEFVDEDRAAMLVVGFEGTAVEVEWMIERIGAEWKDLGVSKNTLIEGEEAKALWQRLAEFPAGESPLVLKANVTPSGTTRMIAELRGIDSDCSLQAHAGNGVVIARFSQFPKEGLSRTLVGRLQPAAAAAHGHVIVLANPSGAETTHQSMWGGSDLPYGLMTEIKRQFDPRNLLNPGRFVYDAL